MSAKNYATIILFYELLTLNSREGKDSMIRYWHRKKMLNALLLAGSICSLAQAAPAPETIPRQDFHDDYTQLNTAGQAAIRCRDYVAAENYFRKARAAAEALGQQEFVREMDARRAAMYINSNEASRALLILSPYIKPGVDKFMLSDYLQALRACNKAQEVLRAFQEYVTDWQTFPVYGLENVAAVCLRQKKYAQAQKLYETILARETPETVPYVQLGYAYTLARLGHKGKAIEAYRRASNIAPRYNNIITGDAAAFILEGQLGIARQLFNLLGKTAEEKEAYQLLYAQNLVNAGRDLYNENRNFQRDEALNDRSYYHEAAKILRQLQKSHNPDIVHEAKVTQAANKLNNELLADTRQGLRELLAEDDSDMAALTVQNAYESQQLHSLTTFYESAVDNKRNRQQAAGIGYDSYFGHNIYVSREIRRNWLNDDDSYAAFWQSSTGLRKKYDWGEIAGEWIRYNGAGVKSGYNLSLGFDLGDATQIGYERGMRLHSHAGAIIDHLREKYQSVSLHHQLTPKTSFNGSYEWAALDDQNKYRSYELELNHLLQIKRNFSDRLLAGYNHTNYDHEEWRYDSPRRRQDYTLNWQRKWNYPKIATGWLWETGLGWGHDNDDRMEITPHVRLEYIKEFPHNQQLRLGTSYYKYFRQANTANNRRHDGYQFSVRYNWRW